MSESDDERIIGDLEASGVGELECRRPHAAHGDDEVHVFEPGDSEEQFRAHGEHIFAAPMGQPRCRLGVGRSAALRDPRLPRTMTDIGDSQFHKGQPVWVIQQDGSYRAAEYVGEGELSAWFGGAPTVIVIYPDTQTGEPVEVDRVIARDLE